MDPTSLHPILVAEEEVPQAVVMTLPLVLVATVDQAYRLPLQAQQLPEQVEEEEGEETLQEPLEQVALVVVETVDIILTVVMARQTLVGVVAVVALLLALPMAATEVQV